MGQLKTGAHTAEIQLDIQHIYTGVRYVTCIVRFNIFSSYCVTNLNMLKINAETKFGMHRKFIIIN